MKHNLFFSMLAAALLGGQAFAETVYKVSDYEDAIMHIADPEATIIVDAQKTLSSVESTYSDCLTLDYQDNFVLTTKVVVDTPDDGVLNITTSVGTLKTKWEDAFSVEGGGSITLCHADGWVDQSYGPIKFLGSDEGNTVQLGDTEVKFVGVLDASDWTAALAALDMNQVGVVWGGNDIYLVGKVEKSVPEPATGTLSLLALAGFAVRRRKK